jgi:hypothetical protein
MFGFAHYKTQPTPPATTTSLKKNCTYRKTLAVLLEAGALPAVAPRKVALCAAGGISRYAGPVRVCESVCAGICTRSMGNRKMSIHETQERRMKKMKKR